MSLHFPMHSKFTFNTQQKLKHTFVSIHIPCIVPLHKLLYFSCFLKGNIYINRTQMQDINLMKRFLHLNDAYLFE